MTLFSNNYAHAWMRLLQAIAASHPSASLYLFPVARSLVEKIRSSKASHPHFAHPPYIVGSTLVVPLLAIALKPPPPTRFSEGESTSPPIPHLQQPRALSNPPPSNPSHA